MLLKDQRQQFVAQVASAKRGWSGSIGRSMGSCFNPEFSFIGMSISPTRSNSSDKTINRLAVRYLDLGLEGHK